MGSNVFALKPRVAAAFGWSQRELSEFYRVEAALLQVGLLLETDQGVSDEGDPWFVFCRADTGEVFIHFARTDGLYVAASSAFETVTGYDFPTLVRQLLDNLPATARTPRRSNVFMHPAAILVALVGAAFYHSGEAKAAETPSKTGGHAAAPAPTVPVVSHKRAAVILQGRGSAALVDALSRWLYLDQNQAENLVAGMAARLSERAGDNSVWADVSSGHQAAADILAGAVSAAPQHVSAAQIVLTPSEPAGQLVVPSHAALDLNAFTTLAVSDGVVRHLAIAVAPVTVTTIAEPTLASPLLIKAAGLSASILAFAPAPTEAAALLASDANFTGLQISNGAGAPAAAANLQTLIQNGEHIDESQVPISGGHGQTTAGDAGGHASSSSATDSTSTGSNAAPPPPSSAFDSHTSATGASAAPISGPPTGSVTAAGPDAGTTVTSPALQDAAITAAVDDFTANVSQVQMVVSGHNITLYDAAVLSGSPPPGTLDAVTFTFHDGSTISLVGTVAELHVALSLI